MTSTIGVYKGNNKGESGTSALVQIVIVLAVVAGGLFGYWKYTSEQKRVADLAVKAKEATEGDDSTALLKAKKLFEEIGPEEKLIADDSILVALAELESQLYQTYGVASSKDKAEKYVSLAKDRDVRKAERYAADAYLLLGQGRAAEAEQVITALTDKGVRHAKLLHALSVAKLAQGKAKEAVLAAQEGQKLSTQLVRLPIAEGDALMALGNFPSALGAYQKATKLNSQHLRARTAISILAAVSRVGKPELLIKEMDRLLDEAGQLHGGAAPPRVNGFIEYGKGEIYLVDNKAQQALELADKSLQTDPGQAATLALKGRALAKLNKLDDAKKAFDEALTIAPSSLPIGKAAALVLQRAGKEQDALAYLQKVQAANPDNGMAWVELSLAQSRSNKAKDALKSADTALEKLGNAHDMAVFAKARALQADGQLDKARETYSEALSYHGNPEWAELYYQMGALRAAEKNWEEAAQLFQQAIKFWDKQGGAIDDVADAWDATGKAYQGMGGKKAKQSGEFFEKAENLRKGKV